MKKGKCKLKEPVMRVDVLTPEDHMGDVIGDLNSRRGMVRFPLFNCPQIADVVTKPDSVAAAKKPHTHEDGHACTPAVLLTVHLLLLL
jgi:hypothetical protein